jgi:electron transfer flavoprotein beta subunit
MTADETVTAEAVPAEPVTAPGVTAEGVSAGSGPLIVACVRHADQRPLVDPLTGAIQPSPRSAEMSAAEEAALEHALRLAEAWGGRVLAITAGPPGADETLRLAAAAGADVLRIAWPASPTGHASADARSAGSTEPARDAYSIGQQPPQEYLNELARDERTLARALAAGILATGYPDLVLCGDHSADRGTGAVPAYLAHELGAAQACGLVTLTEHDGTLTGERRLPGGLRERLRIPRPAVCSVEAAGVRLRRASLPATLAAQRAPVPVTFPVTAPPVGTGHRLGPTSPARIGAPRPYVPRSHVVPAPDAAAPNARVLALTGALVDRDPPTVISPADAASAADALLSYLTRNGYTDGAASANGTAASDTSDTGDTGDGQ